jgi:uncharacterized protein (TIGR02246 family)
MQNDEQAIRDLIAAWMRATTIGDLPKVLTLMAEDVVFLVTGQPPMRGKDAFASSLRAALNYGRIEVGSDIQEIQIVGDWAYCWNRLTVMITPLHSGSPQRRSGYTLTIFRKNAGGAWLLTRDANMLTLDPQP